MCVCVCVCKHACLLNNEYVVGDIFVQPGPNISSEKATETISPLSLATTKALTSHKQTPMSTYGEFILSSSKSFPSLFYNL